MSEKIIDSRFDVEFGNATSFTRSGLNVFDGKDEELHKIILGQAESTLAALDWIKDVYWYERPHIVESPNIDRLYSMHAVGWYARFNSEGYTHLKNHFKCRSQHVPDRITLEWLGQMMERYVDQLSWGEDE